jgi:hypothetical protein
MKAIFVILGIISLYSCLHKKPETTGLEGKSMPSFKVLLADSSTFFDTQNLRQGQPAVLFYFSPRCPYSRAEMEEIIKNIDRLKNIQFCIFTSFPFPEMKLFYRHYHLEKYQNIKTGIDCTDFFARYFNAHGVPYLAIYGNDKKLRNLFVGDVDGTQIREIAED